MRMYIGVRFAFLLLILCIVALSTAQAAEWAKAYANCGAAVSLLDSRLPGAARRVDIEQRIYKANYFFFLGKKAEQDVFYVVSSRGAVFSVPVALNGFLMPSHGCAPGGKASVAIDEAGDLYKNNSWGRRDLVLGVENCKTIEKHVTDRFQGSLRLKFKLGQFQRDWNLPYDFKTETDIPSREYKKYYRNLFDFQSSDRQQATLESEPELQALVKAKLEEVFAEYFSADREMNFGAMEWKVLERQAFGEETFLKNEAFKAQKSLEALQVCSDSLRDLSGETVLEENVRAMIAESIAQKQALDAELRKIQR